MKQSGRLLLQIRTSNQEDCSKGLNNQDDCCYTQGRAIRMIAGTWKVFKGLNRPLLEGGPRVLWQETIRKIVPVTLASSVF